MDSVVTEARPDADDRFDTARITAAVDALAEKHAGREDVFRSALAQLLKAEMIAARATAQAVLLKDRHGRRCAERLCFVQDEIIRILYRRRDAPSLSLAYPVRRRAHGGGRDRRLRPRPDGAGIRHRSACSSCPTSRPPGASRSPKPFSIACGTWG